MTALTAAYDAKRKDGKLVAHPVAAGARVFKGALVAVATATGLAQPAADAAGLVFAGVAYETVDNTVNPAVPGSGAAAAKIVRVLKTGDYTYGKAGAALADIGKAALVADDNSVSTAATANDLPCGVVVGVTDGAHVVVRIDGKVN